MKLLEEYSLEIEKLKQDEMQRQGLKDARARLEIQLEHLKRERREIDLFIQRDMDEIKLKPVEIREK